MQTNDMVGEYQSFSFQITHVIIEAINKRSKTIPKMIMARFQRLLLFVPFSFFNFSSFKLLFFASSELRNRISSWLFSESVSVLCCSCICTFSSCACIFCSSSLSCISFLASLADSSRISCRISKEVASVNASGFPSVFSANFSLTNLLLRII